MLYKSIDHIANAKKIEEKYTFENQHQKDLIDIVQNEKL